MHHDQQPLPSSFVWRGITLERVVYRERSGGTSIFGVAGEYIERPSNPAIFSGTVGMWRYTLRLQADGSWIGTIYGGSVSNSDHQTFSSPLAALDSAAVWWAEAVKTIPKAVEE